MARNEKPTGHVPLPSLGEKKERPAHEVRPHERQIPANRPACPPIPDDDKK